MTRFVKLKWVPMLIQAYYDAQRRVQSEQRQTISSQTQEETNPNAGSPSQNEVKTAKSAKRRRINASARRVRSLPHKTVSKKRNDQVTHTQPFNAARNNRILLRELQAANQKLEELESIKSQLKEFGMTMDGFSKEIERLTKHKDNVVSELHGTPAGALPHYGQPPQPHQPYIHPSAPSGNQDTPK